MRTVSVDNFTVCCACAGLAGYPEGRSEYPQVCHCAGAKQPRWPDHDFNEYATLCWCCQIEQFDSGSKWSSFYCTDCRKSVRGRNESLGRVLVPMGRHSIMNGIGLRGREAVCPEAVEAFARALGDFASRSVNFFDAMELWRPARLQVVLQAAGLEVPQAGGPQELRLAGYLPAAAGLSDHPQFGKRAAFIALWGFLGLPSIPEVS